MRALNILVLLAIVLLLFLLIIVLIGYIMFKASIWLGVGYYDSYCNYYISFIQTNRKILNI